MIFKPTLERDLDDERKLLWAAELLKSYSLQASTMAVEQMKHSPEPFIQFGQISTEARRIEANLNPVYSPHGDHRRLTVTQLRAACEDGNDAAAERLKMEQHQKLKRIGG